MFLGYLFGIVIALAIQFAIITLAVKFGIRDALPHLVQAAREVLAERNGQQNPGPRI
jgi:hypothetical protein